jgi:hypothetical protein
MGLIRKQNITISLTTQTIRKAKILAVQRSTSISGLLAEQVEALIGAEERYEAARLNSLALMDRGFHLGGSRAASRDELHDR